LSKHERGLFERCLVSSSKKYHMDEKLKQRETKMGSCLLRVGLLPSKLKTFMTRFVSKVIYF
jgi:hypothetical protein